jgi:hypothetical protein
MPAKCTKCKTCGSVSHDWSDEIWDQLFKAEDNDDLDDTTEDLLNDWIDKALLANQIRRWGCGDKCFICNECGCPHMCDDCLDKILEDDLDDE